MVNYDVLSKEVEERIRRDRERGTMPRLAFDDKNALRRYEDESDNPSVLRSPFIRDIDKIMHCPYYNRYADKTQVFSFYRNDDITRRALHVQFVSRISRTIGRTLNLNLDLIEAIALGHDIGHTPFGHTGEKYLDEIFFARAGRHFSHNIHSVRVLDKIYPLNITLQTLSGIASHDGEMELLEYRPNPLTTFEEFDKQIEACYPEASWLTICGEKPYEEVIGEMLACDVFVLPTYTEGFPNVILESMACGCAIVTTPVGAIPEMLDIAGEAPCGVCVEPKSAEALGTAIESLLADEEQKRLLGSRAKSRVVEQYSIESVWQQMVEIWKNC